MKVIIAGGRDFDDYEAVCRAVKNATMLFRASPTEIVHGGARGADLLGDWWAGQNGVPVRRFSADWKRYSNRAGPIRNSQMADYADALIALPGGRGTADMVKQMKVRGNPVYEHKE